jgi:outer membrane protein
MKNWPVLSRFLVVSALCLAGRTNLPAQIIPPPQPAPKPPAQNPPAQIPSAQTPSAQNPSVQNPSAQNPPVTTNPVPGQPTSSQAPRQPMAILPSTFSENLPERLAGVEINKTVRWTLKEAILAALESNPDIEINRANVRIAEFNLFAAQGVYDLATTSSILYDRQRTPNFFRFSGTTENFVQTNRLTYNFGVAKYVERTGGFYQVSFNNSRVTSNTSNLSTAFNPGITGNFTQPLLRNFGNDRNRYEVRLARRRLDISDAQFRQQVIEIINTVQNAYWNLAFALRNEEILREAVSLALTQLRNNQRQVEVGTLAPIDVVSAATQVETNRQQVYQAMQIVAQAENTLKTLTVSGPQDELWTTRIQPLESFEVQPVSLSLPEAVQLALTNRPEVQTFALQQEIARLDISYFRNQSLPQVDLVATYGLTGLGGTPALFPDENGVPQPIAIDPRFIGGYFNSLGNLFAFDYPTYRVGINFSFPLRNRTARANLGRARAISRQLDEQQRRQLQLIEAEVRNAYQATQATRLRIDAARAARQYAEDQLAGEEKKFAAGLSTTFLVLQRQNELSQARGVEVRALTDYNIAVADLQRAIATTLTSNNIRVQSEITTPTNGGKK